MPKDDIMMLFYDSFVVMKNNEKESEKVVKVRDLVFR
jgi:hypothetical protein